MLRFAQHDKLRMANLTLLSLSFNKERDVCASRQGEVKQYGQKHKGQIMNLPPTLNSSPLNLNYFTNIIFLVKT